MKLKIDGVSLIKSVALCLMLLSLSISKNGVTGASADKDKHTEKIQKGLEELHTSLDQVLSQLRNSIKKGKENSDDAVQEMKAALDQAIKDLKKIEKDQKGKIQDAVGAKKRKKMLDAVKEFVEGLSDKVLDDVSETVERLNKISEEIK